ncbi:unnamed protein product [Closterium sp. Naga37s-1]|nr:unnamed protein product [Closterium sp. Naga37s-1]
MTFEELQKPSFTSVSTSMPPPQPSKGPTRSSQFSPLFTPVPPLLTPLSPHLAPFYPPPRSPPCSPPTSSFDSATTTIQATHKIFAALPVAPPVYITLAGTTVPGCDPLRCSLPPGNPTWVQPVPSVWQAIGTFTSTPATDPERYGALLQLIDNSLVFPGVVMVYKDAQGAMRPVMGQLLEVGPIPAYVPSPQYVVRFLSYMPGGANISLSQSADGLSFQASFALAVVVPSEEPISVFLNVNLLDALPPPPLPPAGGFAGLTPEALAASDGYNALVALMQYAVTGVKGMLVNATMKLAAIDQSNGPNDLLQRV